MLESDHPLAGSVGASYSLAAMTGGNGKSGDLRRAERLRAALRANLKRRKERAKARSQVAGKAAERDSGGIVGEIAQTKPKG